MCTRIPMSALALAAMALSSAGGCSDDAQSAADAGPVADLSSKADATFPNKPGGNPLVPEVAAYPFPSDFYLKADKTTATGYRVALTDAVMPKNLPAKLLNQADGYSRVPIILAYLTGGIDPKTLPDPRDHALTVGASSPVWLVKEKTWDRVPILVEVDLMAGLDSERALIIRPLRTLDEKSGYVVIVRNNKLRDLMGKAHAPNAAMQALLDGTKTADPAVENQREAFKLVDSALTALKVDRKQVVLAWSFHTRS